MKNQAQYYQIVFKILQITVVGLFLGRAWQHIFWDAPFRTILWDERLMSGFVTDWLSMSWEEYVTSPAMDARIQNLIKGTGYFYLLLAILTVFIKKLPKFFLNYLWLGTAALLMLSYTYMKTAFGAVGQFFEYSLQFSAPVFLWFLVAKKTAPEKLLPFMKAAIAVTFFCHGLYAVGFYPRPGNFLQMTISTFGCSEAEAHNFLAVVAYLDFFVAALLFFKPDISFIALVYCIIWGFMTSFARIYGNFFPEFMWQSLSKWVPEFLYRIPHFMVPLAALFIVSRKLKSAA